MAPEMIYNLALGWANDADGAFSRNFFRAQFTPDVSDELFEIALKHHMLLPRKYAAALMVDIIHQDLRDVLPRIDFRHYRLAGNQALWHGNPLFGKVNKCPKDNQRYLKPKKEDRTLCSSRMYRNSINF